MVNSFGAKHGQHISLTKQGMAGQDNQSLSPTKSSNWVGQDSIDSGEELSQGPTEGRPVPEVEAALLSLVFGTDSVSDIRWMIGARKGYFTSFM